MVSHAMATEYMREMRGTTFDPAVLDAFFEIEDAIKAIAETYRDEAEAEHAREDAAVRFCTQSAYPPLLRDRRARVTWASGLQA